MKSPNIHVYLSCTGRSARCHGPCISPRHRTQTRRAKFSAEDPCAPSLVLFSRISLRDCERSSTLLIQKHCHTDFNSKIWIFNFYCLLTINFLFISLERHRLRVKLWMCLLFESSFTIFWTFTIRDIKMSCSFDLAGREASFSLLQTFDFFSHSFSKKLSGVILFSPVPDGVLFLSQCCCFFGNILWAWEHLIPSD